METNQPENEMARKTWNEIEVEFVAVPWFQQSAFDPDLVIAADRYHSAGRLLVAVSFRNALPYSSYFGTLGSGTSSTSFATMLSVVIPSA